MNLREIARLILSESIFPMTAREVWEETKRRGLDKTSGTKGKTPDATMGAYLYVASRNPKSGIVAEGSKPVRFRLARTDQPLMQLPPKPAQGHSVPQSELAQSKFLAPCLEVLKAHAPTPMGVSAILKSVLASHPELPWKNSNGGIRAALLRNARAGGPVRQVPGIIPPLFFVGKGPTPAMQPAEPKGLSYLECAEKVLREFANQQPMHYRDITAKALSLGWLVPEGANPANVLNAIVGIDIRKRKQRHRPPLFVQHGRGYIGLAEWIDPIQTEIERHNAKIRERLLEKLRAMDAIDFENLLGRLLDEMDFLDTQVTRASGDGGIDVRGTWKIADGITIKMAIQAKRWKKGHNVQSPIVDAVRGALASSERGMIITTSDFSKGAIENAEDKTKSSTISLVNGEQLVKLLVKHGIGVKRTPVEILELDGDAGLFQGGSGSKA